MLTAHSSLVSSVLLLLRWFLSRLRRFLPRPHRSQFRGRMEPGRLVGMVTEVVGRGGGIQGHWHPLSGGAQVEGRAL